MTDGWRKAEERRCWLKPESQAERGRQVTSDDDWWSLGSVFSTINWVGLNYLTCRLALLSSPRLQSLHGLAKNKVIGREQEHGFTFPKQNKCTVPWWKRAQSKGFTEEWRKTQKLHQILLQIDLIPCPPWLWNPEKSICERIPVLSYWKSTREATFVNQDYWDSPQFLRKF